MSNTREAPSYYAIIPANVRYDKDLKANEKLLYGEITCLSQTTGECFAGNSYFAELYGVTIKSISTWISNLKDKGYITTRLVYKENSKEVLYRYINIGLKPLEENVGTPRRKLPDPLEEKVKDNTIKNNNIKTNTVDEKFQSETINPVNEKKIVPTKVRDHMVVVNEYETEGTYNLNEIASKAVVNAYETSGLEKLAVIFLDWCVGNKDKLEGKVNIKARFNKFVQSDFQGVLKKKADWPGIDSITDEQFIELMDEGYFRSGSCEFYKSKVRPTLDTQGINTFQLMIEFFRNRDIGEKKGLRFKERLIATGKIIA